MNPRDRWTPQALELLQRMHAENKHSFADITAALQAIGFPFTRNSVIAKAHRLKLTNARSPGHKDPNKPRRTKPQEAAPMLKTKTAICSKCRKPLTGTVPADAREVTCFACDNPPSSPRNRTGHLIDLDPDQCRWPLGKINDHPPYMFCTADAVPMKPYCTHHCSIAYQPVRR